MCLGIPGCVVAMSTDHPDLARVDVEGVVRNINMALLDADPPGPGDWVLIHLGFALERMTQQEVDEARSTLSVLGEGSLDDDPFAGVTFESDPFLPAGYGEGAT